MFVSVLAGVGVGGALTDTFVLHRVLIFFFLCLLVTYEPSTHCYPFSGQRRKGTRQAGRATQGLKTLIGADKGQISGMRGKGGQKCQDVGWGSRRPSLASD